jgi:hypothetical protein
MGSYEPFGHLQHKLWQKKKPEVKLIVWLKSRRSTRPQCVKVECNTPLESSQGELQVCLDLIPIGGLNKELWPRKIPGVQTETVSGLLFGSPETKNHSDVGTTERHRVYYMGEGGGFPQIRAMVSHVSPELPMACPSTKGAPENEVTNLLVS